MASIERTAYPRFRRLVTAAELAGLSPTEDEATWARERTRSDEHLLALSMSLAQYSRSCPQPQSKSGEEGVTSRHPVDRESLDDGLGVLARDSSATGRTLRWLGQVTAKGIPVNERPSG